MSVWLKNFLFIPKRFSALFFFSLFAFSIQEASAQSAVCARLYSQLASMEKNGASQKTRQYDKAIQQQGREIKRARRSATRSGCIVQGRLNRQGGCASLSETIRKMERNLSKLQRLKSRSGGRNKNANRIKRVQNALKANQCGNYAKKKKKSKPQKKALRTEQNPRRIRQHYSNDRTRIEKQERSPAQQKQRGFFSMLFGQGDSQRNEPSERYGNRPERDIRRGLPATLADAVDLPQDSTLAGHQNYSGIRGSTYRTLCVRHSDGFYWPISFSTTRQFFSRDERICKEMCPSTDVSLYVYNNPGEAIEAMRSARTDTPYTSLASAFSYRQNYQHSHSCAVQFQNVLQDPKRLNEGKLKEDAMQKYGQLVGLPPTRPNFSYDPDSIMNIWGRLDPTKLNNTSNALADSSSIRIVGPDFSYIGVLSAKDQDDESLETTIE